jgi:tetratricopeptide (TPR) repeat protein
VTAANTDDEIEHLCAVLAEINDRFDLQHTAASGSWRACRRCGPAVTKGPVAKGWATRSALAAGDYASALQELDGIVASEPQPGGAHRAVGAREPRTGTTGDAAPLRRSAAAERGAMWAKEGLANVLRRMGSTAEADQLCVEVIDEARRYEEEEDLRELVGWCELRLGRYDDAVRTLREALRRDGRWIAVRFDLALALLCAGDRVRAFLEYSRGVHQAVNGGVERLRGIVSVAIDDLEECLAERPALATTREAIAARNLLASTLPALPTDTRVG